MPGEILNDTEGILGDWQFVTYSFWCIKIGIR